MSAAAPTLSLALSLALTLVGAVVLAVRHQPRRRTTRARLRPVASVARATTPGGAEWAEWLDHAAAEVRSGHSLNAAISTTERHTGWSPATPPHGRRARANHHADQAVVVTALAMATAMGGPVAATLQQAASVLRERLAVRAEADVHASQSRLSALVLTLLPVAVAVLGATGSASFRWALTSPPGTACAVVGAALNLVGWRWMRRVISRVGS